MTPEERERKKSRRKITTALVLGVIAIALAIVVINVVPWLGEVLSSLDAKPNPQEAREARESRKKAIEKSKAIVWSRYRNNDFRTDSEGYFFKGVKYALGDGVTLDELQSIRNFYRARDLAGPNDIKEFDVMINYFSGDVRQCWNQSKDWDGYY